MNIRYYFILFFCFIISNNFAQTHTWTGNGNGYSWSDPDNWDQGTVPLANGAGTVIIPGGAEVHSTSIINFSYGEFRGGGTFYNEGELNLINNDEVLTSKKFSNITILSQYAINIFRAPGTLNTDPVLLNEGAHIVSGYSSGVASLVLNSIGISFNSAQPGFLEIQSDFIKTGIEDVLIDVELLICCYDFTVSEGLLTIESSMDNTILSPGFQIYPNARLVLKGNNIITGNGGGISGNIQGILEITNSQTENPSITGTVFFDAEGEITLNNVTFQGDGTFISRVNSFLPENSIVTFDGPRFSNQRIFKSSPQSSIFLKNGGNFINVNNGEMILNGGSIEGINNEEFKSGGLISIINNTEYEIFGINFENSGIIDLQGGSMILDDNSFFYNQSEFAEEVKGEVIGPGNFKFPSYNINTIENGGIFSPGLGMSDLNTENFSQTEGGFIKIDIESLTNFDKILNSGPTYFEGRFDVTLDFSPSIGDEFIVYQTDMPITNCNPVLITSAEYNNQIYIFDIICNSNNITLKLNEILAIDNFFIKNYAFYNQPNPVDKITKFIFSSETISTGNPTIVIYNYLGQKVVTIDNYSENDIFKRGNLTSGLYFVQLKDDGKVLATTKMILE